jgi:DNA modification methylase
MDRKEKYERVDFMDTYGIIPYSIWETDNPKFSNKILKFLKERSGESTREGTLKSFGGAGKNTAYTATTSYFNPNLCKIVYSSYCPKNGWIFDPFSSVVRPYVAKELGYNYIGCEIRKNECDKITSILKNTFSSYIDYKNNVSVENIDCRNFSTEMKFDLIFTCPPYWNLEKYSNNPNDMSTIENYDVFLDEMKNVYKKCLSFMHDNSYACFVVSDFRDYSNGRKNINRLIPFVADMIKTAENAGLVLYDKVILKKPMGTAPSRVKMWNTRKTVRIHEELLVFKK